MLGAIEVHLWGRLIGAVSYDTAERFASFEYNREFLRSGIELSPIMMPLRPGVFRFPQLSYDSFHGLPGLLSDSLPDRFGNILIEHWLREQGRTLNSFSPIERLCYTGTRGMGALEFQPSIPVGLKESELLAVDEMVALASHILQEHEVMSMRPVDTDSSKAVSQILQIGTSAGGARAKAVIAYHPETKEVRSGQIPAPEGFEYWLMKFDGVTANRDKELADPLGSTVIEYVYSQMVGKAGIEMSPCRLLEEHDRSHFLTKRFDREEHGRKLHMQSLGALAHLDYNMARAHSYEQAFSIMRQLGLPADQREQLFRRMVFNIVARNQDDHVKNISFLMNRSGQWRLAPAYDVTYSYQPGGLWTGRHQMSICGKGDDFTIDEICSLEPLAGLVRGRAKRIIDEVKVAVALWPELARQAGVSPERIQSILRTLRLDIM